MKSFTCDETRSGFSDYLAGECGRPEANLLEVHLGGCEACRAFAEKLVMQDRMLVELGVRSRLDSMAARIGSSLEPLDQVEVGEGGPARSRRWLPFAAAAVFIFAAGAAAVFFWPSRPAELARETPPPAPRPDPLPVPTPRAPEPRVPDPAPETPVPAPRESQPPVEGPKPAPPGEAKVTVSPEKRIDPNLIPKEVPLPPVEARDANKPAPPKTPPPPIDLAPPRTVDEAINRGVAFLRLRSAKLDFSRGAERQARSEELVLWTYFMAGVPESDPEFQRLFKGVLERKLEKTYDVALQAMLLEELDRVKYQWRLHQCAQFLVDNQCKNGQWSYGEPSLFVEDIASAPVAAVASKPGPREFTAASSPFGREKPPVRRLVQVQKRREGPESGDNSNSMYAALGLRACNDAGVQFPETVVRLAEKAWRDAFHDEGWCYGPKSHTHKAYGSMTAGAVGSLVIYDSILRKDWRKDREVELGLKWLAKNFSVTYNPGPYEHGNYQENSRQQLFYYLYALERAGILYGTEKLGAREWYKEGSKELLDTQRLDGAWSANDELHDTCFGILFLRRATRGLPPPLATK